MSSFDLGPLVKQKRDREGLSLRDAGEASGVAFSTLGRIENGGTPSLQVAQRIQAWLEGKAPLLPPPPMTLRDWFAGQAVGGLLAGQYAESSRGNLSEVPTEAYAIADALLAERSKAGGQS